VSEAIPIAAGGVIRTYPLIGTTSRYYALYGGVRLRDGRFAEAPFEVVLGAEVARASGLRTGASFALPDASEPPREDRVYRVAGILWPTGSVHDRVAVTDLASVWPEPPPADDSGGALVSEPPAEDSRFVNALVLRAEPGTVETLALEINARPELQAVSPARETARLADVMTAGLRVLRGFALLLVIAAAFSVFIGLYGALSERRYDLAIMRALGASPGQLMALLLFEGVLLAAIGAVIGIALGHVATGALGFVLRFERVGVTGWMWSARELWVLGGALLVGVLAALVPAWRAHETDIAKTLARG
jgi:putative ABC transport system permease protein